LGGRSFMTSFLTPTGAGENSTKLPCYSNVI